MQAHIIRLYLALRDELTGWPASDRPLAENGRDLAAAEEALEAASIGDELYSALIMGRQIHEVLH